MSSKVQEIGTESIREVPTRAALKDGLVQIAHKIVISTLSWAKIRQKF